MNPLSLAILFLILRPIIRGLTESSRKKQEWQKRQKTTDPQQMFREIFKESFEENTSETPHKNETIEEMHYEGSSASSMITQEQQFVPRKENQYDEDMVKEEPVPKMQGPIEPTDSFNLLDEDNILRGIILKEILDKPKYLR